MSQQRATSVAHLADRTRQPWVPMLRRLDAALAAGKDGVAERTWHDACHAAFRAHNWEALMAVGDAYLRIGDTVLRETMSDALISQIYRSALHRAVRARSVEGVLRIAERFTGLGDEVGVEEGLAAAAELVEEAQDPAARKRLDAIRAGWADEWLTAAVA